MSTFRLATTIGLALSFALLTARADTGGSIRLLVPDPDFQASLYGEPDYGQADAFSVYIGSDFAGIVAEMGTANANPVELIDILNAGGELDAVAETLGLDIADQDTEAATLTLAGRGKANTVGLGDVLAPTLLVLGTALTSFAFFTRRKGKQSRRAYYSKHAFVALPPSRTPALRTSPSGGSSEPNPRENSDRSWPHRRRA